MAILSRIQNGYIPTKIIQDLLAELAAKLQISGIVSMDNVTGLEEALASKATNTNVVQIGGSYDNPSWITGLDGSKVTGVVRTSGDQSIAGVKNFTDPVVIGGTASSAQLQINVGSSSTKGLIVKAAASPTSNLTEWQTSTGTVLSSINSSGTFIADFRNNSSGSFVKMIQSEANYPVTFNMGSWCFPQDGGRANAVFSMGWNTTAAGHREVLSEPTFRIGLENHYEIGAENWMEGHLFSFIDPSHGGDIRPFSVQVVKNPAGYTTQGLFQGEGWSWNNQGQTLQIMTLTRTPSNGSVYFNIKGKNGSSFMDAFSVLSNGTNNRDYLTLGRVGVSDATQIDLYSTVQSILNFNVGSQTPSLIGTVGNIELRSGLATTGAISMRTDIFNIVDYASSVFRLRMLASGYIGVNTSNPVGQFQINASTASTKGLLVRSFTGQTANLQEWQDSVGNVLSSIKSDGSHKPSHLADSAATNDSIYYSTTQLKVCYKDSAGVVNPLY